MNQIESIELFERRRLYTASFLLRVAIGLSVWFLIRYVRVPLLEDALHYEEVGASVANDWLAGRQSIWLQTAMTSGTQAWFIVAVIAGFYFMLGGIRAVPLLIISYSAVTAYTPVMTFRIARRLGANMDASRFAGRLVAFTPCIAFWAGALYKEGLILLLLNIAVYSALALQDQIKWRPLLLLAVTIPLIYGLRFYLAILVAASMAIGMLFARPKQNAVGARTVMLLRQAFAGALIVLVGWQAGIGARIQRAIPATADEMLERIDDSRADLARSNSGYLAETDVRTVGKATTFLPVGMAYFLTVPLPWHIGRLRQNLTIPETFLWLLMYPLIAYGAVLSFRANRQGTLLLITLTVAVSAFYGIFIGNIGTAYRMRSQVWLFWSIFAGVGWHAWRAQRMVRRRGVREQTVQVAVGPQNLPSDDGLPEETLTW